MLVCGDFCGVCVWCVYVGVYLVCVGRGFLIWFLRMCVFVCGFLVCVCVFCFCLSFACCYCKCVVCAFMLFCVIVVWFVIVYVCCVVCV